MQPTTSHGTVKIDFGGLQALKHQHAAPPITEWVLLVGAKQADCVYRNIRTILGLKGKGAKNDVGLDMPGTSIADDEGRLAVYSRLPVLDRNAKGHSEAPTTNDLELYFDKLAFALTQMSKARTHTLLYKPEVQIYSCELAKVTGDVEMFQRWQTSLAWKDLPDEWGQESEMRLTTTDNRICFETTRAGNLFGQAYTVTLSQVQASCEAAGGSTQSVIRLVVRRGREYLENWVSTRLDIAGALAMAQPMLDAVLDALVVRGDASVLSPRDCFKDQQAVTPIEVSSDPHNHTRENEHGNEEPAQGDQGSQDRSSEHGACAAEDGGEAEGSTLEGGEAKGGCQEQQDQTLECTLNRRDAQLDGRW